MFYVRTKDYAVLTIAMWCRALEENALDQIGNELWPDAFIDNRTVVVVETIGL